MAAPEICNKCSKLAPAGKFGWYCPSCDNFMPDEETDDMVTKLRYAEYELERLKEREQLAWDGYSDEPEDMIMFEVDAKQNQLKQLDTTIKIRKRETITSLDIISNLDWRNFIDYGRSQQQYRVTVQVKVLLKDGRVEKYKASKDVTLKDAGTGLVETSKELLNELVASNVAGTWQVDTKVDLVDLKLAKKLDALVGMA